MPMGFPRYGIRAVPCFRDIIETTIGPLSVIDTGSCTLVEQLVQPTPMHRYQSRLFGDCCQAMRP